MKIYTSITIDMHSGNVIDSESFEYAGPIAECKASKQQKAAANNSEQFAQTLQGQYGKAFGTSQATQDKLNGQIQGVISNAQAGNGYTQPELAALNANNSEQTALSNQNAQAALSRQIQQQSGGGTIPSGAALQLRQQADSSAGANQAAGARNIALNNAQLANSNLMSGLSASSALAGQQSNLASSLAGSTNSANASGYNQVTQAYQPSNFFGNLATGLAGGAINAVAAPLGNKVSGLFGGGQSDGENGTGMAQAG